MNELIKEKIKIARARYNIMFMAVLSIINILLISAGKALTMPFSSSIATYATVIGINASKENANESYRIIGFAISAFIILALLVSHLFSKDKPVWFIIAFSLIAADTVVLITFTFVAGAFQLLTLLDLGLHLLTLYYVFTAIKAHTTLRKLPIENDSETTSVSYKDIINNSPKIDIDNNDTCNTSLEEVNEDEKEEEEEEEEDLTKPIGKFEGDYSKSILYAEYNKLKVHVFLNENEALLVINGYICDSLDVEDYDEYILRAIINGIDFTFDYKRTNSGEIMYLYADEQLLDSLGRQ